VRDPTVALAQVVSPAGGASASLDSSQPNTALQTAPVSITAAGTTRTIATTKITAPGTQGP
jgi:hypothetical protein